MLGIIVCDDDRFMLAISARTARQCIKENAFDATVMCTATDSSEIFVFIEKNPGAYLYFLDIDFGKSSLNGIDVARLIKGMEPLSKIVFVTSHNEMSMRVLKSGVEAFGFIEKSAHQGKMLLAYKKYIALALEQAALAGQGSVDEHHLWLSVGIDEHILLPPSQILYVEADKSVSHVVCYHTVDGSSISVRDTIERVLGSLGDDFIKSHRSVVVNKKQVVSVSNGLVKFANGETAACSFRLKNDVAQKCGVKKI